MSNRIREEFLQKKEPVRLNKYLSEAGVCSRREADRLIEEGKVSVDGSPARTGMRITPGQVVKVGRKVVSRQDEMRSISPGASSVRRRNESETVSYVSWIILCASLMQGAWIKIPGGFCS